MTDCLLPFGIFPGIRVFLIMVEEGVIFCCCRSPLPFNIFSVKRCFIFWIASFYLLAFKSPIIKRYSLKLIRHLVVFIIVYWSRLFLLLFCLCLPLKRIKYFYQILIRVGYFFTKESWNLINCKRHKFGESWKSCLF